MLVIILLGLLSPIRAQSIDMDEWLMWLFDRFGEELDEDLLVERLENLETYLTSPIPISLIDRDYLYALQLLTDKEVEKIVTWVQITEEYHRTETGFRNAVEVDIMVTELIVALVIFDSVELERVGRRRWGVERGALHGLIDVKAGSVYPLQEGYRANGHYLGPAFTLREQVILQHNGITTRFSRQKMSGEPINYPKKIGPWTGSIVYQNYTQGDTSRFRIRSVILGDHRFRSGHGLLAATGSMRVDGNQQRATSISAAPVTPNGASPSGKFHRGAALWATAGKTDMAISYSSRRLSATITDTLLYAPGWSNHVRTANDLNKHHNIRLSSVSVMARRHGQIGPLNIYHGVAAVSFVWSDQISRKPGFSYERNYQGKTGFEWSTFSAITFRDFAYTAEIGYANSKQGWIQSLHIQGDPVNFGLWARRYPFGFEARFGNPASAYGGSNESGFGAWIRAKPVSDLSVMAWTDSYFSLGPRYGTRLPVKGREWGVRAVWRLGSGRWVEMSAKKRSRLENEVLPDNFNREYDFRVWNDGFSAKVAFHNPISDQIRIKLQLSHSDVDNVESRLIGWGSSALLVLNFERVKIYAQTSMFSSEGHDSRSYFYEYDMLGSFRIPAFSGYGQRNYVMGHIEIWGGLAVRIKIGVTEYLDRQVIGTGADASVGARRWGGDAQIRWMF